MNEKTQYDNLNNVLELGTQIIVQVQFDHRSFKDEISMDIMDRFSMVKEYTSKDEQNNIEVGRTGIIRGAATG